MECARVVSPMEDEVRSLRSAQLDEEAIERLVLLRRLYREGRFDELTREARYLRFIRWLYQQGRIGG